MARGYVVRGLWCWLSVELAASKGLFEQCPAPASGGVYLSTAISAWTSFDDSPIIGGPCEWSIDDYVTAEARNPTQIDLDPDTVETELGAVPNFIYQSSNAWGISPDDIGLIGCNFVYGGCEIGTSSCASGQTNHFFQDFVLQFDAVNEDNDGLGVVFGWTNTNDHFKAENINDNWPTNALDGHPGPFMKLTRRTKSCEGMQVGMPESQHCFTTLAHLSSADHADADTGSTFHRSPNQSPSARYASTYAPYALNQCDGMVRPTRYWLIVHSGTARFMRETSDGSVIAVWTDDLTLQGYRGGQVGLFTYANQMSIYNVRVWNLDDDSSRGECSGHGSCDLDRGLCACAAGYEGLGCERFSAAGKADSTLQLNLMNSKVDELSASVASLHHKVGECETASGGLDAGGVVGVSILTALAGVVVGAVLSARLKLPFFGDMRNSGSGPLHTSLTANPSGGGFELNDT